MNRDWSDPEDWTDSDDVVQVLCEVTAPNTSEFPRSCEMPISSGDDAVGDQFVSIGFRMEGLGKDGESEWTVSGWEMTQDCWTDARCFRVLGWLPLASI